MAMNIHQEARRKQVFMDRVCEARRRMAFSQDDAPQASGSCGGQRDSEKVMCTDQGQFYQTSPSMHGGMSKQLHPNCVVFEKLIHDRNFLYRSAVERGLEPPPHVDPIYKLMYPGATLAFPQQKRK
ncbi:uncharacterized protein LOC101850851 isoform X3 [Aplysia californica]|uniref:Uncharacterized protein LOC101850851 isoform X3 n=1 Tax=Aplysia californica TaxID=6500 RepID=A0ABM0K6T0_APLCA|nr:uncharacterized protein LOC101850851 isoform X3 [Aplysia californica]